MPKYIIKNQNFPGFFRYNYHTENAHNGIVFRFSPSSRPKVHVLFDFKSVHQIDPVDLIVWLTNVKQSETYVKYTNYKIGYFSQNNVHTISQVVCNVNKSTKKFELTCNIEALSYVSLCYDFPFYLTLTSFNQNTPSFEHILLIERSRVNNLLADLTAIPLVSNILCVKRKSI